MAPVYIGIGSNLGDRQANCRKALTLLAKKNITILKISSPYETDPWGVKEQPKFINMAAEAETGLRPEELLESLKETEADLGRRKSKRWGSRVIDLDILFYDDLVINIPGLEIPHPGIKDREFVLKPLCEIAPEKIHPVLKKSVKQLLQEIQNG